MNFETVLRRLIASKIFDGLVRISCSPLCHLFVLVSEYRHGGAAASRCESIASISGQDNMARYSARGNRIATVQRRKARNFLLICAWR
jgi:hypothetical protein